MKRDLKLPVWHLIIGSIRFIGNIRNHGFDTVVDLPKDGIGFDMDAADCVGITVYAFGHQVFAKYCRSIDIKIDIRGQYHLRRAKYYVYFQISGIWPEVRKINGSGSKNNVVISTTIHLNAAIALVFVGFAAKDAGSISQKQPDAKDDDHYGDKDFGKGPNDIEAPQDQGESPKYQEYAPKEVPGKQVHFHLLLLI